MISKDKQYRTRDGREVRIYATDGQGMEHIHGAIKDYYGWSAAIWKKDGKCNWCSSSAGGEPSQTYDLVEVKPRIKRTVWLNVYDNEVIHGGWSTKEDADKMTHGNRIACINFDLNFEEGEGL